MPRTIAAILVVVAICGLSAAFSAAAFADGDPASDVLTFEPLFNPSDANTSPEQEAQLQALIKYVNTHGYRLKVALIASPADLGTATDYWEDAGGYASQYLGIELSLILHGGTLLVVMPQTDGLYDPVPKRDIPPGDNKAMLGLPPAGSHLARSAYEIVQRIAIDNGIALPQKLAFTVPTAKHRPISAIPLIGFVTGLVTVAAAWGISLRARPLRKGGLA